MNKTKRLVVKVGTSTLTYETGHLNIRRIEKLVKVLTDLKNSGMEIALVSSGAIGVGVGELGLKERPSDTPTKQAAAAVGQCELMYLYDQLFSGFHHKVAQLLLTKDVIDDTVRKTNVINTLDRLMELGVVPIINENDTVSVEEIVFGDNDTLSAVVAVLCEADLLVLMSDIDGLFDKNPKEHSDAKIIREVHAIDEKVEALAGGAGSSRGTGGMITKLHAAKLANEHGIDMMIVNGDDPDNLYRIFDGEEIGTRFFARRIEVNA